MTYDTPASLLRLAGRRVKLARAAVSDAVVHLDGLPDHPWAIGNAYEMEHRERLQWAKAAGFVLLALMER